MAAIASIPLLYRVYFQTLDPILAISGTYLALADEQKYIYSLAPASILPPNPPAAKSSPQIITFLLQQIATLYLFFGLNAALILRVTSEIAVWRALQAACAVSDTGHLAGMWYAMEQGDFWKPKRWRKEDCINMGILWFGLVLRLSFLLNLGTSS